MRRICLFCLLALLLGSCGGERRWAGAPSGLDTLYAPRYASGFEMYRYGGSTLLEIVNPWQGADSVSKWVFLSRDGEQPPKGFDGTVVPVPVRRVACMSSSYVALLEALGADSTICGISGTQFITSDNILRRIASGSIAEVGYDSGLNYEKLVALQPEVVFIYGITGENNTITNKLHELGLKTVYIGDYVENNPLGRAEWVTVFGEFLGDREAACTLFDSISGEYERARALAATVATRPRVMLNAPWQDSWFVPGDRSYMVRLIEDAGGEYACRGVDSDRSRPIGIETAFVTASQSDYWLSPGAATSLPELLVQNPRFASIPPVKNGRVFNNNARTTPNGGSDFWESGSVYPDRTLKDMIRILHPELLPEHQLYYFRHLQ